MLDKATVGKMLQTQRGHQNDSVRRQSKIAFQLCAFISFVALHDFQIFSLHHAMCHSEDAFLSKLNERA